MSKICVICGEDCSGRPRTKDPRGHYYCLTCYEQAKHRLEQKHAANTAAPPVPQAPTTEADDNSVLGDLLDEVVNQTPPTPVTPAPSQPQPVAVQTAPPSPQQPTGWVGVFLSPRGIGLCLLAAVLAVVTALGDWVTVLFFLFVALAVVNGYWIGAARIGALLGGLIAGALLGVPLGKAMEGLCATVFHTTGTTNRLVSTALCALTTLVIVTLILRVIIIRWQKRKPQWQRYDRLVGSGLGLLEGVLLGFLLLWAVLSLEPIARTSLAQTQSPGNSTTTNPISQHIVSIAQSARGSTVGQLADTINPLNEMRLVTLLAKGLIVINDPQARHAFINHPAIQDIQQRPSVQKSLQMLADDDQISTVLETGSMGEVLRTILASPTLLAIFDQTDIVADLSPLADEIELAINEAMELKTK